MPGQCPNARQQREEVLCKCHPPAENVAQILRVHALPQGCLHWCRDHYHRHFPKDSVGSWEISRTARISAPRLTAETTPGGQSAPGYPGGVWLTVT